MKALGTDILGNIAILKFGREIKTIEKKKFAENFLEEHKNVTTVLEKTDKFKGRLRIQKTKFLAGLNTKEVLYKENNCIFRFNVDTCYFSPRLASERKELSSKVRKNENILVMFGGIAVYAIVIAKNQKVARVVSVEISRECNRYAKINIKKNKVENIVELIQGDVKKKVPLIREKFDRIIMPRPNLKDSFLDVAFPRVKRNGIIYYYGFYKEKDKGELKELIENEAKRARKKIKILRIKKAGDIAPYKFRYRADVKVLS